MNGRDSALSADLAHLDLQVTPENVVQVANVLRAESEYLGRELSIAWDNSHVGEPGEDPVSPWAANGFNGKIDAMYARVQEYVNTLKAASDRLTATARDYGHTDEDLRHSLDAIRTGYDSTTAATPPLMTPPNYSPEATILRPYLPSSSAPPVPPAGVGPPLPVPPPDDGWVPIVPLNRSR